MSDIVDNKKLNKEIDDVIHRSELEKKLMSMKETYEVIKSKHYKSLSDKAYLQSFDRDLHLLSRLSFSTGYDRLYFIFCYLSTLKNLTEVERQFINHFYDVLNSEECLEQLTEFQQNEVARMINELKCTIMTK